MYVSFIFLIELTRELMKDLEAIKGDVIFGYQTIPVALGVEKTKKFAYFLIVLTFIPCLVIIQENHNIPISAYFVLSILMLIVNIFLLSRSNDSKGYHRINTIYKGIILLGIGSIIFF